MLLVWCAGASSWFFGAIQFPSAYSNPSAPGLLVASGNVAGEGYGLDDNDGCATAGAFCFFSRSSAAPHRTADAVVCVVPRPHWPPCCTQTSHPLAYTTVVHAVVIS